MEMILNVLSWITIVVTVASLIAASTPSDRDWETDILAAT